MTDLDALREALDHYTSEPSSLVIKAAREFLRLKENGEKVWWCEEHKAVKSNRGPDECQAYFLGLEGLVALILSPCRMVKKLLVDLP
jgi:hypothetical protein